MNILNSFIKKKFVKLGGCLIIATFVLCLNVQPIYAIEIEEPVQEEIVQDPVQEEPVQEEVEEPVQEEPVQEKVEEPKKEEITEEQIKDIAQSVVEENSQGHVNEEQVNAIVEEALEEENNEIMLMIDYELDKTVFFNGSEFYINSQLLDQYGQFIIYKKTNNVGTICRVYFFDNYNISDDIVTLTDYAYINCGASFTDEKLFDSRSVNVGSSTNFELTYIIGSSIDLYSDNSLLYEKNITISNEYKVSFHTGYDDIVFENLQTNEDGLVEFLPVPDIAPNGFSFGGWYLDELFNTQVDENYQFTSNTTLYAKWVENDATIEMIDYTEKLEKVSYLLEYVIAIMVFFVIVIICKYIYGFFNIFF